MPPSMDGKLYGQEEKEIEKLEVNCSRSTHSSRGWFGFSAVATDWTAIYDADCSGVVASVLHHRMFYGKQVS